MTSKREKIAILIIIALVIPLLISVNTYFNNKYQIFEVNPKISAGYHETFIHIDDNWTATTSKGWCSGDGSWSNPYIIENVTIDASSSPTRSGIYIVNSKNDYFIIRNCTIYNSGGGSYDAGIRLDNTCNGTLVDNICLNNGRNGITLYINCENNTIVGNTVSSNVQNGIYLYQNCDNNNITRNVANENNNGIYLFDNSHYNNITENNLNNNRLLGLRLDYCDNTEIIGNTANFNGENGIYIYWSEWNNITNNIINYNSLIGIYLRFFCLNNIININTINGNDLGIFLQTTSFNNVTNNILTGNNYCIYESSSSGNIILNNDCTSPTVQTPISINGEATGIGARNWTWAESQTWCSGSGTWDEPYIIQNLNISCFGAISYGIDVMNSDVFFIINNCKIYNAVENGIYFETVNNSRLINNNCSNNGYAGIAIMYQSNNNTVLNNIVNDNDDYGIYFYDECNNNTISGNTVNNNGEMGISLHWYINNTIITENIVNNNPYHGIELYDWCGYNKLSNNIVNNNGERGIDLEYNCRKNKILNNIINNNGLYGVYLESRCKANTISENSIKNNTQGVRFWESSDYNIIIGNIVSDNIKYGIYLASFGEDDSRDFNIITKNVISSNNQGLYLDSYSSNNTIIENIFLKNIKHATDDGSDNKWNNTLIGNYWDNHTSPDDSPEDGIVDTPYTYIGGSAGSIDYLPIAEDGAPRITINSPIEGRRYSSAPLFNVEIIDDFLYEMWYTIDGGLTNFTFTENGTIDQSAWDVLPDGTVIITFYARDIPGYEAFKQVTVIKGIILGGLEPWAIVVFILIGAAALLGVAFIYLKKRIFNE